MHAPGHVAGRYLWCCGRCLVPGLLCFITAACVGGKCIGFKRKRKRKKQVCHVGVAVQGKENEPL